MNLIRLIRLPNLLIIAFTQFLVRYCLILPAFLTEQKITGELPPHLNKLQFILLVASTLLIAAGGYIINDINDIDIDDVNNPGKNIIEKSINENVAQIIYYSITGLGVLLGFWIAFQIGKLSLGTIPLFCALSLYMYSTFYKKRLYSGNIIVSVLAALSVLIVGLYEPEFYRNIIYLLYYSLYAFQMTLIREIIKDAEDIEGDERAQCKSIPIRFGIKKTKTTIVALIVLTIFSLLHVLYYNFYNNPVISFMNLAAIFILPLLALIYLVFSAHNKKDFHYASVFTKIYMVLGVSSMAGLWYYFLR